jgi:hypothetical protein
MAAVHVGAAVIGYLTTLYLLRCSFSLQGNERRQTRNKQRKLEQQNEKGRRREEIIEVKLDRHRD